MTNLQLTSRENCPHEPDAPTSASDDGWQKFVIAALGAIVLLVAGWVWTDAQDAKKDTANTIRQFGERLATQEEAMRGVRESLIRIEAGVNELRRDRRP
jgi:hypothetical protein